MKILILGPYPAEKDTNGIHGGVETVVVNMVKGLSRFSDLDIHVVTASHNTDREFEFKSKRATIHVVPADRYLGNATFYLRVRRRISRKIRQIRPDLIHTHMFGYYTMAALDSGHEKVVMSTHGMPDRSWRMSGSIKDKIGKNLWYFIYERRLDKIKDVIVNSSYARDFLREVRGRTIYELNNPVSEKFFEAGMSPEEEMRLLFVGNVSEEKGIMTVLRATKTLKGSFDRIRLMVAGKVSDNGFCSEVVRFIKENGLAGSVHFLGYLDEEELKEQYTRASIFTFPSKQDVAPLALLQAMAAGKAIVTTRVGGIPYIIDDGVNGFLVEKDDVSSLAERITLFIRDSLLRKRFGACARQKVFRDCRVKAVTDRLYGIYKGIMR